MNKEQAASLRKAFAANQIGTLPKGGVRLEYVGHAATTDRLLQVDPDWTWAPVAHDERGLPRLDEHGGLWISLTVCGVTRLGYGDAAGKKGPNSVKEAIGDAIRNAAMRFGVALDLWAKEDLQAAEPAAKKSPRSAPTPPSAVAQQPEPRHPAPPSERGLGTQAAARRGDQRGAGQAAVDDRAARAQARRRGGQGGRRRGHRPRVDEGDPHRALRQGARGAAARRGGGEAVSDRIHTTTSGARGARSAPRLAGQRRPWIYGEPCPAQMRDRLAPEWRHFDAKGNPHYENAVGLPTDGQDESPRVGAATAQRADRRLVRPPYVHVKRTKTAGWQIVYVCKSGKPEITGSGGSSSARR
jgi:hypothetical protein